MTTDTPPPLPDVAEAQAPSRWERISFILQFTFSLAIALGTLAWLIWMPSLGKQESPPVARPRPVVEAVGPRLVRIDPESSLRTKLNVSEVSAARVTTPLLRVTGRVAASLRPGPQMTGDYWQFDEPDVLESYYDWQKALVDIEFADAQRDRIRELAAAQIAAQRRIVERLERLVQAGTDTTADLEVARAELLEREIEARRELHEAETELRVARQSEAVLARQLQLAGLAPELFAQATPDIDIVIGDVPEAFQKIVYVGQQCVARFFGVSELEFSSEVRSVSPVVSPERRTLRALFFVDDPHDKLRPGMFAEIGLGTDPRDAILIPASAVIHVGRFDLVLVQGDSDEEWRVVEVEIGEKIGDSVEALSGLTAGQRIVSDGAILLKSAAMQSLALDHTPPDAPDDADSMLLEPDSRYDTAWEPAGEAGEDSPL